MRISAYARATNPKYANFFQWQALAGQLGTKAGKALSTPVGAAKLGAGLGAGVGAINYLGSEDKSIGNLAGQVAGGAALGGAVGYGGASLKNAWQARKAGQVGPQAMLQGGNPNAPQLAPAAATQAQYPPQPKSYANGSSGKPIVTPTKEQPVQTIDVNSSAIVEPKGYQQPKPLPTKNAAGVYDTPNLNTVGTGTEQSIPLSQLKRPDIRLKKYPKGQYRSGNQTPQPAVDADGKPFSRNTSPFANFKVRRYNGFIY